MAGTKGRASALLRATGAGAVGAFFAAGFTPLPAAAHRRLAVSAEAEAGRAGAIVVLGAGASGEALRDSSLRRLVEGVRLFHAGRAPWLVVLGPHGEGPLSEAELRARLARELKIPPSAVVVEPGGRTTREEALLVAARLVPLGVRSVLLVTADDHLPRAAALFEAAGLEVVSAPVRGPAAASLLPEARLMLARDLAGEAIARLYHRAAGFIP